MIDKFQYITGNSSGEALLRNIKKYCLAGGQWVQLRFKNGSAREVFEMAIQAKAITNHFNTKLIINDYPEIARAVNAYGVHLGRNDMTATEARTILFDHQIVGSTCNTVEHIQEIVKEGASHYIGLGPFRQTHTKRNLSPILGLDGLANIQKQCNQMDIRIPIVAVGGILEDDMKEIYQCGVHGIAASGMIEKSTNWKGLLSQVERLTQQELNYAKFETS